MKIPTDFQFSQSSLYDFETCPRRFELRYLQKLRWPAIESEPVAEAERLARLGQDFHRLVYQHLVGLDTEVLAATVSQADSDLQQWWQNYLAHRPARLDQADLWPELTLSAPLRGRRLVARFDLLARLPDDRFLIVDWKTSRRKPPRPALARRIQTRVYPFLLVAAGAAYNGGQPIDPAAVSMLYWYPQFPEQPEQFKYSRPLLQRDKEFLSGLIEQIKQAARRSDFPKVQEPQPCSYCVYRSLCDRGVAAGVQPQTADVAEESLADLLALEWDQIAEIQF